MFGFGGTGGAPIRYTGSGAMPLRVAPGIPRSRPTGALRHIASLPRSASFVSSHAAAATSGRSAW
jgi:hypothetical protein